MAKRKRHYPWGDLAIIPPDPRRKSKNVVAYGQRTRYGPLEVHCCNGCAERGKTRQDGACRHTDVFLAALKPWWRSRARIDAAEQGQMPKGVTP